MTAKSNPGDDQSTHDLILTNGSTSIGLIICDSKGQRNPLAFAPTPMNRQTLKTYQGTQKHADLEPPWTPVGQTDWSGGRGSKDFDKDETMYYDGYGVNTCRPGEIILGPKVTETVTLNSTGNTLSTTSGSFTASKLDADYYAYKFTASASLTGALLILKLLLPGDYYGLCRVGIANKNGTSGAPESVTWSTNYYYGNGTFELASFDISKAVVSGTDYFIAIEFTSDVPSQLTGYYMKSTTAAGAYYTSETGADGTWSAGTNTECPYFNLSAATYPKSKWIEFDYKGAHYGVGKHDDATNSKLYLNGDQGVVKTGTTATAIIADSGVATWGADDVNCVGAILKIVSGTGTNQPQPWRAITTNTATDTGETTFTVSPAFDVTPAANDIFVIVSSNEWTEIAGFDTSYNVNVTDVLAVNGTIYFACGDITAILAVRAYNNSGAWTYTYSGVTGSVAAEPDFDATNKGCTFLAFGSDAEGTYIYGANGGYPAKVWYATAPDNTGFTGTNETITASWTAINVGDLEERITGLQIYGDNGNLHVLKEASIWQIYDKKPYRLNIAEMQNTKDDRNGMAHCVHGVYLYTSWHGTVNRYYDGLMDRVGPDKAEVGYPTSNRLGYFSSLVSYPGIVIGAIDAGDSGVSSIMAYNGMGWCELYSGASGNRIQNLYIQSIPGNTVDRLWFCEGRAIKWLPLSIDPFNHPGSSYNFNTSGYLTTAWYYLGLQDIDKLFNALRLVIENTGNVSATDYEYVNVQYQIDDGAWTDMSTKLFDAFSEEHDIASTPSASGKRIRFKFELLSYDGLETPRIIASVLEAVTRIPTKYYYAMTVALEDKSSTRQGAAYDMTTALTKFNTLTTLQALATPCLVESDIDMFDGKYMWVDSVSPRPINVNDGGGKKALYVCNMTLIEA